MRRLIQISMSVCLGLSLTGALLWSMYITAIAIMWVFPFVAAFTLGSLAVTAFVAWRRSHGQ